ncbi:MAG: hypothetical protein ACOYML_06135 [Microthrixaceae bacterium]
MTPHRRSTGRVAAVAAATATLTAVLAACAPAPPSPLPPRDPSTAACTSAAMRSCALPYPSDEFTVADATTRTGRRVAIPDEVIPERLQSQLGPGLSVDEVFSGADGFSAMGPVIFEFDRPVLPTSIPTDGGDVVAVFDARSGARVPVRVTLGPDALLHGGASPVVMAWPAVRWDHRGTYVARLSLGARAVSGRLVRAPGMDEPNTYLASVRADLRRIEGDRWSEYVSVTRFSVRSAEDATSDLDAMVAASRAAAHPVRNLRVAPPGLYGGASAVVTGEVQLSDFRGPDGRADPANGPTPSWEQFLLVLPRTPAGPNGAPVEIYGHGLTVSKETMFLVAGANAERGVATIGIDVPNHGDRRDEGGYLLDIATPRGFGRLASIPAEAISDNVGLIEAVRTSLAGADLAPWRPDGSHGDGVADLDPTRLLYSGTSMGGVLGAGLLAYEPGLSGAYLQVAGTGIAEVLFTSVIWPLFAGVIPAGAGPGDAAALQGAATMVLDQGEHGNLIDRIRAQGPPVFLQYGTGDGIVRNVFSDRMMHLLDLPLVGPDVRTPTLPVRRLAQQTIPSDGRGAVQVFPLHSSPDLAAFFGHVSFGEPRAEANYRQWLDNRLAAMYPGR